MAKCYSDPNFPIVRTNPRLPIEESELEERFVRASGPGGQHVNKAATAVQLRFNAAHSPSLPQAVRDRLLAVRDPRITTDGIVIIFADRFRSQARNRADARERLAELIALAARPVTKRRPTRLSARKKQRRLNSKTKHGRAKTLRKPPSLE